MEWVNDEEAVEMNPTCDCGGEVDAEDSDVDCSWDGTFREYCWGQCPICGRHWEWTRVFRFAGLENVTIKKHY